MGVRSVLESVISEGDTWPIVFAPHAGWLHAPPQGKAGALGVVLCAPLGRDARCAHRPLRLLAQQLAAAGICVLRYDHLGTGDSLDLPDAAGDALGREGGGVIFGSCCDDRPLRLLAQQLAAAGICVLRYDHLGTGDSLDLPDAAVDA